MNHIDLMRDVATTFPELERKSEVRSLRVWHCKYKSLKAIEDFINLEELVIASVPDKSLSFLLPLQKLRYISILHMPKVTSITELSNLRGVESLSLATSPAWDAAKKCTIVDSLSPISKIDALKHVELLGVCPPDKVLAALQQCRDLQSARFSQYPKDEVERFYRDTRVDNLFNPKPLFSSDHSKF